MKLIKSVLIFILKPLSIIAGLLLLNVSSWASSVSDSTINRTEIARKYFTREFRQLTVPSAYQTDPIIINDVADDSVAHYRAKAKTLKEKIIATQRFRERLDASTLLDLPIGIAGTRPDANYAVYIDKIVSNPKGVYLQVFMSIQMPQWEKSLDFMGVAQITHEGGITGTARLFLIGEYEFDIGQGKITFPGSEDILSGKNKNFVEFDCDGFKGMSLQAIVEFSKDLLVAESPKGEPLDQRVKFEFTTYINDLNDLLLSINIPPFQIKGVKGLGFSVKEAYLDWSDLASPPGFSAPADYLNPYEGVSQQANLWRGVYIKRADVKLPPQFKENGDTLRRAFGAENLMIDDTGFTGSIFGENLISNGDMSGWAFTMDKMQVKIVNNNMSVFSLAGRINIPAFEKDSVENNKKNPDGTVKKEDGSLAYSAFLSSSGNYQFDVTFMESVQMKFLSARLKLSPNSTVSIGEQNNKFIATASLNGQLTISAPVGKKTADLKQITFERLVISNQAPYFRPGTFSFGSPGETSGHSVSGFPLTINALGMKSEGDRVGFFIDASVNLVPASDEGFSGSARLTVWGKTPPPPPENPEKNVTVASQKKWEFDKVELEALSIHIVKEKVYELRGSIAFFDGNELYGNGFKGQLSGKLGGIQASAEGMFGKTETMRYWYANALICSDKGIPLSGFSIYGFGGGAYYHMKQAAPTAANALGKTLSGVTYVPDDRTYLGLKASVFVGTTGKPETMNGDATFEISLNKNGGINFISITGNIYFMTPEFKCAPASIVSMAGTMSTSGPASTAPVGSNKAQLSGHILLVFDNVNDSFHGNVEVYVNVLGGALQGVGPNHKAGWAELYFSKSDWYVLIGTPTSPIGLDVARLFQVQSYFMMGINIPGSPPPPQKVSSILGGKNLDYMRDANALKSGLGFAFGVSLSVDTGDLRFLIFYGRFAAGAGLDIMVKDYGNDAHCEGFPAPLGINGWYANGQAYAYLEGKIGLKVNLMFYKGEYDILKIGAAAVLQARGPNPFWMNGTVGGYYEILGGLVKGNCNFEVTVGKPCKIVTSENALQDVTIIAEVSPVQDTRDVNVFDAPQAAFNIPIGKVFDVTDSENKVRSFRATLNEFTLNAGNGPITGSLKWNDNNDVVAFEPLDILPPQKKVDLKVKITFEERINGAWTAYQLSGKPVEEIKQISFNTGTAPDFIPASNVASSYPVNDQYNYYPSESSEGFIELKRGQPYLFEANSAREQKARFKNNGAIAADFSFTYNEGAKTLHFALPTLGTQKNYVFEIADMPKVKVAVDQNVKKVETKSTTGEIESTITTKDIEGTIAAQDAKVIYTSSLRTSKYVSFAQKLNSYPQNPEAVMMSPAVFLARLQAGFPTDEPFDKFELSEPDVRNNLVQLEADLGDNNWYKTIIQPLVYEGYPIFNSFRLRYRNGGDENILGVPPVRSITIDQNGAYPSQSNPSFASPVKSSLLYMLMETAYFDFKDVQQQVANYVANGGTATPHFQDMLKWQMPNYIPGTYKIKFSYQLPGPARRVTTSRTLNMVWTVY